LLFPVRTFNFHFSVGPTSVCIRCTEPRQPQQ
jgi:hypothetical protein